MSSISVKGLGKAYKQYANRWSKLADWVLPWGGPRYTPKWILQDVSFEVARGEAVGIVGVNGAGKSTLLKMITGTTQPTTGSVQVNGRVAALLELGMGFHPEFTGRQNVMLTGQMLGHSAQEMEALMPSIEKFADIGSYIDEPIRVYSSGMQARLAFSVATCSQPDILIVDEALSVGDIAFQAKCMQRMNQLLEAGVTILFVSHALNQIRQFCQKAAYIKDGRLRAYGPASEVSDLYQNDLVSGGHIDEPAPGPTAGAPSLAPMKASTQRDPDLRKYSVASDAGSLDLEFMWFKVFDAAGRPVSVCRKDDELTFRACITANKAVPAGAAVGLLIADKSGYHLFACNTNYYDVFLPAMQAGESILVSWSFKMPLVAGELRIDSGIKPDPFSGEFYDRVFCIQTLTLATSPALLKKNFGGYLYVDADVKVDKI